MNGQPPYQPPVTPPPYNPGRRATGPGGDGGWRQPDTPQGQMPAGQYPPGYGRQAWPSQGQPYAAPGYCQGYCGQPWQPYAPGQQRPSNGIGTAGFVLAIVSVFIGWVPLLGWLIWILGAVFSFIGLFRQPRGLAIAGVIISLVLIPMVVTLLVALDAFTSAMFLL